ncbi:hypothetical protein OIU76_004479 [Salix suchowensis]|nr:hypothetical protein OIU76_004479 [Salix suchowensis]
MPPYSSSLVMVLFLLLIVSLLSPCHGATVCNQDDQGSLLSFSSYLSSPLIWDPSTDCCLREGVDCNETVGGRVTSLSLPFRDLTGTLSPSLANLTSLAHLNLSHNRPHDHLPVEFFSSLSGLQVLDLSYNHLDGELPSVDTSNLIPITIVDLSSNHFDGELNHSNSFLRAAWNLRRLNVSNNSFTSQIPSKVCHISPVSITLLEFSSNDFNGNLTPESWECSKLEIFRAGFNNLSGMIPDDLYKTTSLVHFPLPVNYLSGPISDVVVNLINLQVLCLHL